MFGIILSYGAIELLAAMVMRANTLEAAGGCRIQAMRTRRMLMAIYRGFCVMNCWNPINLMTAVVSTAVPAAPMRLLLPIAFVVSVGMAALGWLEDRLSAARLQTRGGCPSGHDRILGDPLAVSSRWCAGDAAGRGHGSLFGISLVAGVTLVVPLVALGLARGAVAALRGSGQQPPAAPLHRRADVSCCACPLPQRGDRAGRLRLHGRRARQRAAGERPGAVDRGLPSVTVPLLIPLLLIATGQIGLNPVAVVALIGAAFRTPPRSACLRRCWRLPACWVGGLVSP